MKYPRQKYNWKRAFFGYFSLIQVTLLSLFQWSLYITASICSLLMQTSFDIAVFPIFLFLKHRYNKGLTGNRTSKLYYQRHFFKLLWQNVGVYVIKVSRISYFCPKVLDRTSNKPICRWKGIIEVLGPFMRSKTRQK